MDKGRPWDIGCDMPSSGRVTLSHRSWEVLSIARQCSRDLVCLPAAAVLTGHVLPCLRRFCISEGSVDSVLQRSSPKMGARYGQRHIAALVVFHVAPFV